MAFWHGNRPSSELLPLEPITHAHASIVKATDPVALHLALPVVTWRPRRDQLADCYDLAAVALLAERRRQQHVAIDHRGMQIRSGIEFVDLLEMFLGRGLRPLPMR